MKQYKCSQKGIASYLKDVLGETMEVYPYLQKAEREFIGLILYIIVRSGCSIDGISYELIRQSEIDTGKFPVLGLTPLINSDIGRHTPELNRQAQILSLIYLPGLLKISYNHPITGIGSFGYSCIKSYAYGDWHSLYVNLVNCREIDQVMTEKEIIMI